MSGRKQRMSMRDAMAVVDDDMPDGAYWAMCHEMAGLDYGDGFDELAGEPGQHHETIADVRRRKPFKCLCCHRRFASKVGLEQHNQATGHTLVHCPTCSKKFGDAAALKQHMAMKHEVAE
jgi:hypothetical protein